MLVPSNATPAGLLPKGSVMGVVTALFAGLILDTVSDPELVTQMLVPSNATPSGRLSTVMGVPITVPVSGSILDTVPDPALVTQMLVPSNATACG